ncbi:MAG: thermonuclease family protein [Elusimicrobiota bacterium]|nr:thermonuclease family protein [Elusimicrobiota bacterium]
MVKRKVTQIIDGDTFKVTGGKAIRLAEVRAPEKGTRSGAQAKHDLRKLIEGKTVDYNTVGKSYGRDVAKVKVNKKSINQTMRNKGYKNKGR